MKHGEAAARLCPVTSSVVLLVCFQFEASRIRRDVHCHHCTGFLGLEVQTVFVICEVVRVAYRRFRGKRNLSFRSWVNTSGMKDFTLPLNLEFSFRGVPRSHVFVLRPQRRFFMLVSSIVVRGVTIHRSGSRNRVNDRRSKSIDTK